MAWLIFATMRVYLDDISGSDLLFPFGSVKSVAHIRIGMMTILEKWQQAFPGKVTLRSETDAPPSHAHTYNVLQIPSNKALRLLENGDTPSTESFARIRTAADIFKFNDWALREDFETLTKHKTSEPVPSHVIASGHENIFIEPGADIRPCFINAEAGPVYISAHSVIMEGAMIRGPFFLGSHSVVKMGAAVYGSTTVGPYSVVSGEVKNCVIMGYSNKGHEGYLGDSVIGEWCNLGAGTSNSNLKNNASEIRITINPGMEPVNVGLKCGLIMGDYSRSAVNTTFNTGTVVGICCNIFGLPPERFVPSFSWGTQRYLLDKALRDIGNWKKLKGFQLESEEENILKRLYHQL